MKNYKDHIDSSGNIEEPEITLDYRDLITFNAEERKKTKERLRKAFLGEVVVEKALDDAPVGALDGAEADQGLVEPDEPAIYEHLDETIIVGAKEDDSLIEKAISKEAAYEEPDAELGTAPAEGPDEGLDEEPDVKPAEEVDEEPETEVDEEVDEEPGAELNDAPAEESDEALGAELNAAPVEEIDEEADAEADEPIEGLDEETDAEVAEEADEEPDAEADEPIEGIDEEPDAEADEVVDVAPEEAEAVEVVEKVEDVEKKKEEDKGLPVAAAIALGTIAIGGAAVRTFFKKKKRRDG